jgi:hypothetical protein
MKIEKVVNSIYHLRFDTQYDLCSTFLRFQEHYESPEFRGKIFTLKEFQQWYIRNSPGGKKTGCFTYYEDWSGFNIPSKVFKSFIEGKFDPLTEKELFLIETIKNIKDKDFYIIGTYGNNSLNTFRHEIAHGLFYTDYKYRKKVEKILNTIDNSEIEKITDYFKSSIGYHNEVFMDELNSYILCDLDFLKEKGIHSETLNEKHVELKKEYEKITKGLL